MIPGCSLQQHRPTSRCRHQGMRVFRVCPRALNRECIRSKTRVFCMPLVVSSNKRVTLIVIPSPQGFHTHPRRMPQAISAPLKAFTRTPSSHFRAPQGFHTHTSSRHCLEFYTLTAQMHTDTPQHRSSAPIPAPRSSLNAPQPTPRACKSPQIQHTHTTTHMFRVRVV